MGYVNERRVISKPQKPAQNAPGSTLALPPPDPPVIPPERQDEPQSPPGARLNLTVRLNPSERAKLERIAVTLGPEATLARAVRWLISNA